MTTEIVGGPNFNSIFYTKTLLDDLGIYLNRRQQASEAYPKFCARYGIDGVVAAMAPFAELRTSVALDTKSYMDAVDYVNSVIDVTGAVETQFANYSHSNIALEYVSKAWKALLALFEERNNLVKEFLGKIHCHMEYYPTIQENLDTLNAVLARNNPKETYALICILELSKSRDRGLGVVTQQSIFSLTQTDESMRTVFTRFRLLMLQELGYMETFDFLCSKVG